MRQKDEGEKKWENRPWRAQGQQPEGVLGTYSPAAVPRRLPAASSQAAAAMSSRPASLKLMYFDGRGAMEVTWTMLVRSI
jgi:hypothetical protein